jgi:hypothetical protein
MDYKYKLFLVTTLYGGFFKCPTTGDILAALPHDDKVLCGCGKTNPKVARVGHREGPGTHVIRFLERATAKQYVDQEEERWKSWNEK